MTNLRVFAIGGYLSYRALFNWQSPTFYIPTMLAGPLFQILFFAYLGRFSHVRSDAFFVVGNAVQVSAMAGVFGMSITLAGERWTQTLSAVLATPANRAALFLGRALPNIVNGLIVSAFGFLCGRLLLDFHPALSTVPALALVVLVTTLACTAFGLCVGGVGLRLRDAFLVSNPTYFLMLLFCGVNIPLSSLPRWMQIVSDGLPLTHGIEAARKIADGASLGSVTGPLWREMAVGAAYACLAYVIFRVLEVESRRRATLDRM
jgi:ABC-2 type transport system permease protein